MWPWNKKPVNGPPTPPPPSDWKSNSPQDKVVFYQSAEDDSLPEVIGKAVLAVWDTIKTGGTQGGEVQVQDENGETIVIHVYPPGPR